MENILNASIKYYVSILILYPTLLISVYLSWIDKYFNIDKQYQHYHLGIFILSFQKALISPLSLVLEVWNEKTTYRKSWPANHLQVSNLTSWPLLQGQVWSSYQKVLISALLLVLGFFWKSWPENLLHVSNLTPASRSSGVIILKQPYMSYILVLGLVAHNINE